MTLLNLENGTNALITGFTGGKKMVQKLTQYGIFPGDKLTVIRSAPFDGPVMISINGREIALSRGIAVAIQVEMEE